MRRKALKNRLNIEVVCLPADSTRLKSQAENNVNKVGTPIKAAAVAPPVDIIPLSIKPWARLVNIMGPTAQAKAVATISEVTRSCVAGLRAVRAKAKVKAVEIPVSAKNKALVNE